MLYLIVTFFLLLFVFKETSGDILVIFIIVLGTLYNLEKLFKKVDSLEEKVDEHTDYLKRVLTRK